jgi:hypothetical protein
MAGKKLSKAEVELRTMQCYKLRYETIPSITVAGWLKWCKENYGNKSEQQYTAYWMKAGELYKQAWKQRLEDSVGTATEEMTKLLKDEDPRVRQRAVEQVMRYSGNEGTEKIEIIGNIELKWGTNE